MDRIGRRVWIIILAAIVVVFAGTVLLLNATLYSASGFVGSYLDALARHDVSDALATPGVTVRANDSLTLLRSDAMGSLDDIRIVSDTAEPGGSHRVVASYRAGGRAGTTSFEVERDGTHLGLFSAWRFTTTPVSTLALTPQHDAAFTANGLSLTAEGGASSLTNFAVLTPGAFTLSHSSHFLVAKPKTTLVTAVGSTKVADVDIQANAAFVKEVQKEIDSYLAKCVTQKVLLPTGCPMGQKIEDRVQDTPAWSMVEDPVVTIVPGNTPGSWLMPATEGRAHLVVTVKSIFDGTVSTFDQDVPFTVAYLITFQADGSLLIAAQY